MEPEPARTETPARPEVDFLPEPFPAPRLPAGFDPAGMQRLVVNPFLAVAALVGLAWLTRRLITSKFPPTALGVLPLLALLPFLVQWHCLDCGATGPFHQWRRHACARVIIRERSGRRGWLAMPRPVAQLVAWLYLLTAGGLLLGVLLGVYLSRAT